MLLFLTFSYLICKRAISFTHSFFLSLFPVCLLYLTPSLLYFIITKWAPQISSCKMNVPIILNPNTETGVVAFWHKTLLFTAWFWHGKAQFTNYFLSYNRCIVFCKLREFTSSLVFGIFISKVEKLWSLLTLVYVCLVLLLNLYLADEPLVAYKHLQTHNFIKERL